MTRSRTTPGLLTVVLALATAGCIPARFSGYEPSGPGKRHSGYCVAGIRDNLLVEAPSGVAVHWRAFRDEPTGSILMDLYLSIPAGVTVRLVSPELVLRSDAWPQPQVLPVRAISAPGPREFGPGSDLVGSDESSMGYFSLWFFPLGRGMSGQTGVTAVPAFTASLPPLEINGQTWESAPVSFEAYTRWGVYTCAQ